MVNGGLLLRVLTPKIHDLRTLGSKRKKTPKQIPENLPENMTKPDKPLLSLRVQMISARKVDDCKLCNQRAGTGPTVGYVTAQVIIFVMVQRREARKERREEERREE